MPARNWDTEIDTPATVAVIGGGAVGIEAALYARYLGYSVCLFDSAKIGDTWLRWGETPMSTNWAESTSTLGLAALEAQGTLTSHPPENVLSHRQFVTDYLLPLARTDLLYEHTQVHTSVRSISRSGSNYDGHVPAEIRAEREFRLMVDSRQRSQYGLLADIILDCSGLESRRLGMACGGGLAAGEEEPSELISFGKQDIQDRHRSLYAGQHTALWGNNRAAAHNFLELIELLGDAAGTRVSWIIPTGKRSPAHADQPISIPEEQQLEQRIASVLERPPTGLAVVHAWGIEAVRAVEDKHLAIRVQTSVEETLDIDCDRLINCAPCLPDWGFATSTEADRTLATDELPTAPVITAEPHYYVLGQKSWGAGQHDLRTAREQIRQVFGMIGGRQELDVYATFGASASSSN